MFGYLGKYAITGPGRNNWDLALMKNMPLPWFKAEYSSLQFRAESYNTFNHPQWASINMFCSGATTPAGPCNGAQNIGNAEVASDAPPRVLQLGLKFLF